MKEFVPPDLQECLRDQLYSLKQKRCSSLEDHISRFRIAIMQIKDMSELDKITYFVLGLVSPTKEEVQYRRCTAVLEALSIALEYDRSHYRASHFNNSRWTPSRSYGHSSSSSYSRARPAPQRPAENEPEPMEIDSGRVHNQHRDTNHNLAHNQTVRRRYCKKLGHIIEQCFKLQNRQKHDHNSNNRPDAKRGQFAVHTLATEEPDAVKVVEINHLNTATIQTLPAPNELIRKPGLCEGKRATIMLDTGATCNVIRPGLVDSIHETLVSQVALFDGSTTDKRAVHKGKVTIEMDRFKDVDVLEWTMSPENDVILGKPWSTKYQPIIDWRTHELQFKPEGIGRVSHKMKVSAAEFKAKTSRHEYEEIYRVKVVPVKPEAEEPPEIVPLLDEFADVFPDALPDGLPPHRRVEFELNMKSDAMPSHCGPFRLSKTEQDALDLLMDETLKKGWIEISDSPWVSNIFGIPKKDPKSEKRFSRAEWLRSGNYTSDSLGNRLPSHQLSDSDCQNPASKN